MTRLLKLRLPRPELSVRHDGRYVLGLIRRRWLRLTPEEWVRQHVIGFLRDRMGVPPGLMAVEKGHQHHAGVRRTDVTVYTRHGNTWMIVECKAPSVPVSQSTLDQVARYASDLAPEFVAVTNGMGLYVARRLDGGFAFVDTLPLFPGASPSSQSGT